MPLYTYKCPCEHKFTRFSTIRDYQKQVECEKCHQLAERFIDAAPAVKGDYPGYSCPITGDWIEGRRAHEENLAKHGCRVLETGETERAIAVNKQREAAFEASVEATAEAEIAKMDSATLEALACGLDHGLDVEVSRSTKIN